MNNFLPPDLPPGQMLLRPIGQGDIRLGEQLLNFLQQHVTTDGDAEGAIGAMLGIYNKHRLLMGDEQAMQRLARCGEAISRKITFKSVADILNQEKALDAVNDAAKEGLL